MKSISAAISRCLLSLLLVGCTAETGRSVEESENPDTLAQVKEPIINGTPVDDAFTGIVEFWRFSAVLNAWTPFCTATMIRNKALVTAAHCVNGTTTHGTGEHSLNYVQNPTSLWVRSGTYWAWARTVVLAPNGDDVAMVETEQSFWMWVSGGWTLNIYSRDLYTGPGASLGAQFLLCAGYGDLTANAAVPVGVSTGLHFAWLLSQFDPAPAQRLRVVVNGQGQIPWHGDSGGPCLLGASLTSSRIAGVISNGTLASNNTEDAESWWQFAAAFSLALDIAGRPPVAPLQ